MPLNFCEGLDPAGPFFNNEKEKARLSASDAHLVDVIHTNGGGLLTFSVQFFKICARHNFCI